MILQGTEREKERGLILLGAWPFFPALPVKRDWQEDPPGGVIFWEEADDRAVDVYIFNIWAIPDMRKRKGLGPNSTWQQIRAGEQVIHYDSLDAFFDAGWRGD